MKINKYIDDFMKSKYGYEIPVIPGEIKFNSKCHWNSVREAEIKKQDKIIICWVSCGDGGFLHFVNTDDKKCFENTLGSMPFHKKYEYRVIDIIYKEAFHNVEYVLSRYHRIIEKEVKRKFPIRRIFENYNY